ncbi:hypothetical protein A6P39_040970 [Streptomyces sp. FXJ1.172]|uniref:hypothetical protein n=1 Tax=Streptomyces sp. FXJ1.172 TaxID=710705 RepID=UPI0007CEFC87
MTPADQDGDAARLREAMAKALAGDSILDDSGWRAAVERVPRHRFVPGFYPPGPAREGKPGRRLITTPIRP